MSPLQHIVLSGLAMAAIALVGSLTLVLSARTLQRILRPLVAFAAGALLGGAFFHMLPAASNAGLGSETIALWTVGGFLLFMVLEQLLHWHHCHRASAACKQPLTYLILLGDALHNFIGALDTYLTLRPRTRKPNPRTRSDHSTRSPDPGRVLRAVSAVRACALFGFGMDRKNWAPTGHHFVVAWAPLRLRDFHRRSARCRPNSPEFEHDPAIGGKWAVGAHTKSSHVEAPLTGS